MKIIALAFLLFFLGIQVHAQSGGARGAKIRGVDFRMQINSGALNFTGISGVQRDFSGFGSQLSSHMYLFESGRFRSNLFFSTRVMSYTGKDVLAGETDDLQIFTLAPGLEISYGLLHLQAAYQSVNVNSYFVSSFSSGRSYAVTSPLLSAHLNFRLGNLGLGIGATHANFSVDPTLLGLASTRTSQWNETTYSFNMIYFIGLPPGRFFRALFK